MSDEASVRRDTQPSAMTAGGSAGRPGGSGEVVGDGITLSMTEHYATKCFCRAPFLHEELAPETTSQLDVPLKNTIPLPHHQTPKESEMHVPTAAIRPQLQVLAQAPVPTRYGVFQMSV